MSLVKKLCTGKGTHAPWLSVPSYPPPSKIVKEYDSSQCDRYQASPGLGFTSGPRSARPVLRLARGYAIDLGLFGALFEPAARHGRHGSLSRSRACDNRTSCDCRDKLGADLESRERGCG
eukprot:3169288-Rhodomonas_salina.1